MLQIKLDLHANHSVNAVINLRRNSASCQNTCRRDTLEIPEALHSYENRNFVLRRFLPGRLPLSCGFTNLYAERRFEGSLVKTATEAAARA